MGGIDLGCVLEVGNIVPVGIFGVWGGLWCACGSACE